MKRLILSVLLSTSAVLSADNLIDDNSLQSQSSYKDYIEGSISGLYTVPYSNSYSSADEDYGDSLSSISIDLLLFKKYYGGLYLGYTQALNSNGSDFYIEKTFGKFSLYYKNISSEYDATINSKYGTNTMINAKGNVEFSNNSIKKTVDFSQNKIEFRYYGVQHAKDRGYFSLFYEHINTGLTGDETPRGSGNISYYTDATIDNYALYMGFEQYDYMMDDGWDVTKMGVSMGMAEINYTDTLAYENGAYQYSFGVNLEFAYKHSFNKYTSVVFAGYADLVGIGTIVEYGTLGARCALTF